LQGGAGRGAIAWLPRYLDDANRAGNDCGGEDGDGTFRSETLRNELRKEARP